MVKGKKGDGSNSDLLRQIVYIIIAVGLLILVLWKVFGLFPSSAGQETKKSFTNLNVAIDKATGTSKIEIVPFSIEKKYALVFFDEKQQKAGDFVAPSECALLKCLAVCEGKECKVLTLMVYDEKYSTYDFSTNTKDGVLLTSGKPGVYNLYVIYDEQKNTVTINKETQEIKRMYENSLTKK